ncbi:MAG TPA: 5'-3' exonuclease H3TH domain-containing protein, partial [Rhodanobacteraceae bacterium]|nr:5'-3' exonuclease H3TH domain-containing protein [Rhodanobacteraceae bacterium]
MPKLTLIDGSSYLYRAFHALPPLSNAAGEPTGALFGVVGMLRAILNDKPDFAAFVMDAPGRTFRDDLYPAYKATRAPMPDDLRSQVAPMLAIVEALGFPILNVPGVEADDVIGTLAQRAAADGIDVEVSTSDKDFAQLVGPRVTLVNTMTRSSLDRAGVIEKFGVPPERIVDYLALMGDSIDNIPGVAKCGPKTAAKWLNQYGTLDAVIARAGEVGGKIGENLRAALEQLPLSRQLATIRTDLALDVAPGELLLRPRDTEALRELYTRYEFRQALKELEHQGTGNGEQRTKAAVATGTALPGMGAGGQTRSSAMAAPPSPAPGPEPQYDLVTTQPQLDEWLAKLAGADLIAFDTETTSLDPMRAELVGLSFAVEAGRACYIPIGHDCTGVPQQLALGELLASLKPILEDPQRPKLGQHAKYDSNVLSHYGIVVRGIEFDTMLESYVLNATASRHDMDTLARRWLAYDTVHYEDICGKGARQIPFSQVDLDTACRYAAEDADITLRLHQALWPQLQAEPGLQKVFTEIEMPLVPVLARM